MTTTTKAAPKARTCSWKVNGETRCGKPLVRPSAATCKEHAAFWMEKRGRKLTAFSLMTTAEIAKAKAARPKPVTKAPAPKRKASRPAAPKAPAKPAVPEVDPMEREIAAVKAMKERDAAKT